jgi:hypothetical protein
VVHVYLVRRDIRKHGVIVTPEAGAAQLGITGDDRTYVAICVQRASGIVAPLTRCAPTAWTHKWSTVCEFTVKRDQHGL